MSNAKMDENSRETLTALSSANDGTIVDLWADPTTHALLVDGDGLGTVTQVDTGTGLTGGPITTTGTVQLDSKLAPMDTLTGNTLKYLRVNAGETAVEWATVSGGGTPGGATTNVQYNDSGNFGGDANFTWDKTAGNTIQATSTGLNILSNNGASSEIFLQAGTVSGATLQLDSVAFDGNAYLFAGTGGNTIIGNPGYVAIQQIGGSLNAILDSSLLASTDKTFTFPNISGTFVLTTSFVDNEVVSGSGTTFTLANTPVAGSVHVYGAGQRLKVGAGNDYTISGATITTVNTYSSGDLIADYRV